MRPALPTTAGGKRWALVDFSLGGTVFRYTDRPGGLSVSDAAGRAWVYEGGASARVPARTSGQTRGVAISLPAQGDQWPRLAGRGHEYEQARVTVRTVYVSPSGTAQTLEACPIVIDGRLTGVSYGDEATPLEGTVEPDDLGVGVVPALDMVITSDTFTAGTIGDQAVGKAYPIIIGEPGQTGSGTDAETTPGYLVIEDSGTPANGRIMVAGHAVAASTVTVKNDEGATASLSVSTATDALGRTYSYVTAGATLSSASDRQYFVAWDAGGGLANPEDATSLLTGAGDVILWLITTWAPDFRLDLGAQVAAREALNQYRLDFAITKMVDPIEFVRRSLAPVLPVDEIRTPNGTAWVVRRIIAEDRDVVTSLDATPGTGNVSSGRVVQVEAGSIANRIQLQYGPTGRANGKGLKLIADSTNVSDTDSSIIDPRKRVYYPCVVSQQRYGVRVAQYGSSVIQDEATADLVLRNLVMERAYPRRRTTVTGGTWLDWLQPNDVVKYTDPALLLTDALCIVRGVDTLIDTVTVELEIVDDPARRSRLTT